MAGITAEDHERVYLLRMISDSRGGFKQLSLKQLVRLQELIEKKDYSHDKKARKSKAKLLSRINVRIYELTEGRGIWGDMGGGGIDGGMGVPGSVGGNSSAAASDTAGKGSSSGDDKGGNDDDDDSNHDGKSTKKGKSQGKSTGNGDAGGF